MTGRTELLKVGRTAKVVNIVVGITKSGSREELDGTQTEIGASKVKISVDEPDERPKVTVPITMV
jgi:hypothetical protein